MLSKSVSGDDDLHEITSLLGEAASLATTTNVPSPVVEGDAGPYKEPYVLLGIGTPITPIVKDAVGFFSSYLFSPLHYLAVRCFFMELIPLPPLSWALIGLILRY